jgi:hypothetical protein
MKMPAIINRWIKRCERAVGVIPVFAGIFAFAAFGMCGKWKTATFAGIAAFAVVGLADVFHINRKAALVERRKQTYKADLFLADCMAHPTWKIKIFKEFSHGNAVFNTIGFEQAPVALCISEPLCPTCGNKLVERISIFFPGLIFIKWVCNCGYKHRPKKTLAEVQQEAARLGSVPVPEKQ